jgi:acyl-coenzyme A synthetase/AMP-(fatty) acid ligase
VAVEAAEFGGHVICCAYVPRAGVEAGPGAIKEGMTALIPKYMLPVSWRRMETLPANANGKVDRVALAEMFRAEVRSGGGHPISYY